MAKNDASPIDVSDIAQALALLTRLPVLFHGQKHGARGAWAYPLVGLVVGSIAAFVGVLAHWAGLPPALTALVSLCALVATTGAMHEDGLADTADGLWGGWTRDQRLEIMKDSHIGAYGVIALVLTLLARWSALWMLFQAGPGTATVALLVSGAVSRASMPALMVALPQARQTGLSQSVGTPTIMTAWIAALITVAVALALSGGAAVWVFAWAILATYVMGIIANRKIGGQTGDILGATQQITEITVLFCLVV